MVDVLDLIQFQGILQENFFLFIIMTMLTFTAAQRSKSGGLSPLNFFLAYDNLLVVRVSVPIYMHTKNPILISFLELSNY